MTTLTSKCVLSTMAATIEIMDGYDSDVALSIGGAFKVFLSQAQATSLGLALIQFALAQAEAQKVAETQAADAARTETPVA